MNIALRSNAIYVFASLFVWLLLVTDVVAGEQVDKNRFDQLIKSFPQMMEEIGQPRLAIMDRNGKWPTEPHSRIEFANRFSNNRYKISIGIYMDDPNSTKTYLVFYVRQYGNTFTVYKHESTPSTYGGDMNPITIQLANKIDSWSNSKTKNK